MNGLGRFFEILGRDTMRTMWIFVIVCWAVLAIKLAHDFMAGRIPWPLP